MYKLAESKGIQHQQNINNYLEINGYAFLSGEKFRMGLDVEESVSNLRKSFEELPVDPYDHKGLRHRRYGRFLYIPWQDVLLEQPAIIDDAGQRVVEYVQPLSFNSEHGGKRRPFTPLHPVTRHNIALLELIRFDFWSLPIPEDWAGMPITVGVHQVSLYPANGKIAVSSPNHFHQDGEPFTYVHLMERRNVEGGFNYIGGPELAGFHPSEVDQNHIKDSFLLESFLDSFVVYDKMVSHYVGEVMEGNGLGVPIRAALLIDFTPNFPNIG